jgi:hypothetical protein
VKPARWGPLPYVAGATVQGRDHRARGRENQDAFRGRVSADRRALAIAVSDGLGSEERSALGAHIAVDAACRVLTTGVPADDADMSAWQSWLSASARAVVEDFVRVADAAGRWNSAGPDQPQEATAELEATLAAAVICPPWLGFSAIGDSFGAVLTGGPPERCHLVLPPRSWSGRTDALSSPASAAVFRSFLVWEPELSGVVLATDGCAALALDHPSVAGLPPSAGPQPAPGFFLGLAAAVRDAGGDAEPAYQLLTGEQARRCPDDLTVLAALAPAAGPVTRHRGRREPG